MNNLAGAAILFMATLVCIGSYAARPAFGDEIVAQESEEIITLRASFNEAIKNHDAERIAAFLDSEYQITTSSGEHFRETPEEDAAAWTEIFRDSEDIVYVRTPDVVEVSSYRNFAAETGTWVGRWTSPKGAVEMGGSYFAQWRNVSGEWKIRAEVFVGLFCNGAGC